MQTMSESTNLKWQAISRYQSQIDCVDLGDGYSVTCGYMRAFVKKHEFFWKRVYTGPRQWPAPYTTNWTSTSSIGTQAQVIDGKWTAEAGSIRPLITGYDRAVVLGQRSWTSYEVTVPITYHWFDQTKASAGAGVAIGWQGHTLPGQPFRGHPYGGLCSYGRATSGGSNQFAISTNKTDNEDTFVAVKDPSYALKFETTYILKFRRQALSAGTTRYSCKVWQSGTAAPADWTLTADLPDWPGETGIHPGSTLLLAHNADVTFGNVSVTQLP
jgi:hypothetical protein